MERRRRVGAYGIARDDQGRVLLVRSSIRSNHPGTWFLPGGGLEHGEDPASGVAREFFEETGLTVEVTGLRQVSADMVEFPWRGVLLHHDRIIFDVKVLGGALTVEEDGTSDLPEWVEPERVATLTLAPFAARTLGVPVGDGHEVNPRPPQADENRETAVDGRSLSGPPQVVRFGAYGVVTGPDDRVLLSLIAQDYPGGGRWHLPGGGTDFGEQPEDGLLREIFEETGQRGEITRLVGVGSHHNPAAMGPEREPLDWYGVRAIYRVSIPEPTEAQVTELAGGSTASAQWFRREELAAVPLTELAASSLLYVD
jgi:8-oxo-dGTP diphosphatase